jgi:hypothetical protein
VVDKVKVLLVWVGFEVLLVLVEPLHPARSAVAPSRRPTPHFSMVVVPLTNNAAGESNAREQERFLFMSAMLNQSCVAREACIH